MSRLRERRELRQNLAGARLELDSLRLSLEQSYTTFNSTTDPEILEACILEISALRARYSAALRNLKSMDGDKIKWRSQ